MQLRPFGIAFLLALVALLLGFLVLIGVLSGSFTDTDALAVAVILLAVAFFVP